MRMKKTANNVENVENVQETQNIEKEQVKVHYFRVPKDEKLRIDWQKAIDRTDLNLNYNPALILCLTPALFGKGY